MPNVCDEYTEIDVGECTCENCMTCDDKGINMTECMAMHGLCDTDYFEKE